MHPTLCRSRSNSYQVFSFTGVIWRRYLYTRTRRLLGLLSLLTWVASTLGLCISFTRVYVVLRCLGQVINGDIFSGHKLGLCLFSADVSVAFLVRAVCDIRLLMEFDPDFDPDRRTRRWWGWWNWRRDETPLGVALVYDLILSATIIAIVWVLGAYVLHEPKEPFSYFELKSYTVSPATIPNRNLLTSARFKCSSPNCYLPLRLCQRQSDIGGLDKFNRRPVRVATVRPAKKISTGE